MFNSLPILSYKLKILLTDGWVMNNLIITLIPMISESYKYKQQ